MYKVFEEYDETCECLYGFPAPCTAFATWHMLIILFAPCLSAAKDISITSHNFALSSLLMVLHHERYDFQPGKVLMVVVKGVRNSGKR